MKGRLKLAIYIISSILLALVVGYVIYTIKAI